MTHLETTLLKIAKLLNDNDVPYILIGGYSMALHGCPRLTQDLDITLGLDIDHFDEIINIVDNEFKTIVDNPKQFAEKTNVLLLEDKKSSIRIDLIFSFIDFERQAIKDADTVVIEDIPVKNVSLENLIVYKILAGRERDKEDVKILLNTHKKNVNTEDISKKIKELSLIMQNNAFSSWQKILSDLE